MSIAGIGSQTLPIGIQQHLSNEDCTELPNYLKDKSILRYNNISLPTNPNEVWPNAEDLKLDKSQFQALKCALTQKFVTIQGRPGTGKTYLASKIVQILLQNQEYWERNGPMIILSYSNNSLDQLLESILPYTNSFVRIATPTQKESLKSYSLIEKYKQLSKDSNVISSLIEKISEIESILKNIKKYSHIITCLLTPNVIVPLHCLFNISFTKIFKTDEQLICWLFGEDKKNSVENARTYLVDTDSFTRCEEHAYENEIYSYIDFLINKESIKTDSFKLIDLFKYYDNKIISLKQQIEQPQQEISLENFTVLKEYLEIIQQEKSHLKNFFAQHPILNRLTTSLNNPRWNKYWQWVKSSYEFVSQRQLESEKAYQVKKLEIYEIIHEAHTELLKKQKVIGLTFFDAKKILSSSLHITGSIVLMEDSEFINKTGIVWSQLKAGGYKQYILFWNEQFHSRLSELQKNISNLTLDETKIDIKKICIPLTNQHRMHWNIDMLFTSVFYENSRSRENCESLRIFGWYPDVRGLKNNLFFIDNRPNENKDKYGIQYIMGLVQYLLQEYQPSDITILCLSNVQGKFKNQLPQKIEITTVKKFEGKENKIIILSLMTDNEESMCDEKTLFIALSRAQLGLYIMGNMHNLVLKNAFWIKVKKVLEKENCIDQYLEIRCRKHNEQFIKIKSAEDFKQYLLGGCSKILNASFKRCGHEYTYTCLESNSVRKKYKICKQQCSKKCPKGHPCPAKCFSKCPPCPITVKKELLCGHIAELLCSEEQNLSSFLLKYKCMEPCTKKCSNNHPCKKRCYEKCEKCDILVTKIRICGHEIPNVKCFEDVNKFSCEQPCNRLLICGHKCSSMCSEACSDRCHVIVEKMSSCGHKFQVHCYEEATPLKCDNKCQKKLACGHFCTKKCKEPCTEKCDFLIPCHLSKENLFNKAQIEIMTLQRQLVTLNAENAEVKEKVKDLQSTPKCVCTICKERRVTRLFEVCKHACMCEECYQNYTSPIFGEQPVALSPNLIKCPVCRKFGSVVNIYIS